MSPTQDKRASRIVRLLSKAPGGFLSVPVSLCWLQTGECQGSKHHSPSPLVVRPVHLSTLLDEVLEGVEREGQDLVYLCSTCRDNIIVYLSILYAYDGAAPLAVRRDFGNLIVSLGNRAWTHWKGTPPV